MRSRPSTARSACTFPSCGRQRGFVSCRPADAFGDATTYNAAASGEAFTVAGDERRRILGRVQSDSRDSETPADIRLHSFRVATPVAARSLVLAVAVLKCDTILCGSARVHCHWTDNSSSSSSDSSTDNTLADIRHVRSHVDRALKAYVAYLAGDGDNGGDGREDDSETSADGDEDARARYPFPHHRLVFLDDYRNDAGDEHEAFAGGGLYAKRLLCGPREIDATYFVWRLLALDLARSWFAHTLRIESAADAWLRHGLARHMAAVAYETHAFGRNETEWRRVRCTEKLLRHSGHASSERPPKCAAPKARSDGRAVDAREGAASANTDGGGGGRGGGQLQAKKFASETVSGESESATAGAISDGDHTLHWRGYRHAHELEASHRRDKAFVVWGVLERTIGAPKMAALARVVVRDYCRRSSVHAVQSPESKRRSAAAAAPSSCSSRSLLRVAATPDQPLSTPTLDPLSSATAAISGAHARTRAEPATLSTARFFEVAAELTGMPALRGEFSDQWVRGGDYPRLRCTYLFDRKRYIATVTLTQRPADGEAASSVAPSPPRPVLFRGDLRVRMHQIDANQSLEYCQHIDAARVSHDTAILSRLPRNVTRKIAPFPSGGGGGGAKRKNEAAAAVARAESLPAPAPPPKKSRTTADANLGADASRRDESLSSDERKEELLPPPPLPSSSAPTGMAYLTPPMDSPVLWLRIDPHRTWLAPIAVEADEAAWQHIGRVDERMRKMRACDLQLECMWMRQLQHDRSLAAQLDAIARLAALERWSAALRPPTKLAVELLLAALDDEKLFYAVRVRAATTLAAASGDVRKDPAAVAAVARDGASRDDASTPNKRSESIVDLLTASYRDRWYFGGRRVALPPLAPGATESDQNPEPMSLSSSPPPPSSTKFRRKSSGAAERGATSDRRKPRIEEKRGGGGAVGPHPRSDGRKSTARERKKTSSVRNRTQLLAPPLPPRSEFVAPPVPPPLPPPPPPPSLSTTPTERRPETQSEARVSVREKAAKGNVADLRRAGGGGAGGDARKETRARASPKKAPVSLAPDDPEMRRFPMPHRFADFADYRVKAGVLTAIARCKDADGRTPTRTVDFVTHTLAYHDNAGNSHSDVGFLRRAIRSLGGMRFPRSSTTVAATGDGDGDDDIGERKRAPRDGRDGDRDSSSVADGSGRVVDGDYEKVWRELLRWLGRDEVLPSKNYAVTSAVLEAACELELVHQSFRKSTPSGDGDADHQPEDAIVYRAYLAVECAPSVRVVAFECVAKLACCEPIEDDGGADRNVEALLVTLERVDDDENARMLPVFARTWARVYREHRADLDRFRVDSARNRELRRRLHSVLRSLSAHDRIAASLSVAQLLDTLWGRQSLVESPVDLRGGDAGVDESKAVAVAEKSVTADDAGEEEEAPAPRRRRGRPKKGKAVVVPSSSPSSSLPLPNESTRVVAKSLPPTSGPGASPNAERRKNAESESECRRRARFLSMPHSDTS